MLGEHRLLRPALADRQGIYARPLARSVTRFAWHLTSGTAFAIAAMMIVIVNEGQETLMRASAWIFGSLFFLSGLVDAAMTKGEHVGWPMLTLAGALALASLTI